MSYLIATDLDGTLLRRDGTVSERTRQALAAAREAGLPVVFVTGRPPRWLPPIREATGHSTDIICANGGLVLDAAGRVMRTRVIDERIQREARARLQALRPGFEFGQEEWEGQVVKLLARDPAGDPAEADELLRLARSHLDGIAHPTHSAKRYLLLEMSAHGVDKGEALDHLVEIRNWRGRTVIAAGDMPNDRPLLEYAHVACTVTGGHPALHEIADRVIPDPEQDGMALLIEEILAVL